MHLPLQAPGECSQGCQPSLTILMLWVLPHLHKHCALFLIEARVVPQILKWSVAGEIDMNELHASWAYARDTTLAQHSLLHIDCLRYICVKDDSCRLKY